MKKVFAVILVLVTLFVCGASAKENWSENMYPRGKNILSYNERALTLEMAFEGPHLQFYLKDWTSDCKLASTGFLNWREVFKSGIPAEEAHNAWNVLTGGYLKSEEENEGWTRGNVSLKDFIESLPLSAVAVQGLEFQESMFLRGWSILSFNKSDLNLKVNFDDGNMYFYLKNEKAALGCVGLGDWRNVFEKGIPVETAHEAWEALTGHYLKSVEENESWTRGNVPFEEFVTSLSDYIL